MFVLKVGSRHFLNSTVDKKFQPQNLLDNSVARWLYFQTKNGNLGKFRIVLQ
jgi:hypothetical protein